MIATLNTMGRKKSLVKTTSVRVSEHIARMIDIISTAEKLSSAEICDPILEPVLLRRHEAAMKRLNEEAKAMHRTKPEK